MNPKKYKKLIDEVVGDEEYMPTDQVFQPNFCHCPDFANFLQFFVEHIMADAVRNLHLFFLVKIFYCEDIY